MWSKSDSNTSLSKSELAVICKRIERSWGTFVKFIQYKVDWNDKQIVKIDRFYPSSKTCCECGWINQSLTLSIREWNCQNGHLLDRDVNAAKNILKEGLKIISSGTGDYNGGD